ncbi:MAG TPA: hypothetical protein VGY99_06340 [Candidatus Binataceae bacterium]|jgi:hypothetical protein|nr:hypothetical protein [Candidatus Binataceae bacterium]
MKDRYEAAERTLPETGVIEKRQSRCEVLLGAREIAKLNARNNLKAIRAREPLRATFAKRKLKRLIGKRNGGGPLARDAGDDRSRTHPIDKFCEAAALLGQWRSALDGVDRFRSSISCCDAKHPDH